MCVYVNRSFCYCLSSDLYLFSNYTSPSTANKFKTKREAPDQSNVTETYLTSQHGIFIYVFFHKYAQAAKCTEHWYSYCSCWSHTENYAQGSVAKTVTDSIKVTPRYHWVMESRDNLDHQKQPFRGQLDLEKALPL